MRTSEERARLIHRRTAEIKQEHRKKLEREDRQHCNSVYSGEKREAWQPVCGLCGRKR